jgi:hypothetical protein
MPDDMVGLSILNSHEIYDVLKNPRTFQNLVLMVLKQAYSLELLLYSTSFLFRCNKKFFLIAFN